MAQRTPRKAQRFLRERERRILQEGHRRPQEVPRKRTGGFQEAFRTYRGDSQETARRPPGSTWSQESVKKPQETPKKPPRSPQEVPKMFSRGSQEASRKTREVAQRPLEREGRWRGEGEEGEQGGEDEKGRRRRRRRGRRRIRRRRGRGRCRGRRRRICRAKAGL